MLFVRAWTCQLRWGKIWLLCNITDGSRLWLSPSLNIIESWILGSSFDLLKCTSFLPVRILCLIMSGKCLRILHMNWAFSWSDRFLDKERLTCLVYSALLLSCNRKAIWIIHDRISFAYRSGYSIRNIADTWLYHAWIWAILNHCIWVTDSIIRMMVISWGDIFVPWIMVSSLRRCLRIVPSRN